MSFKGITRRNALAQGAATGLLVLAAPALAQRSQQTSFVLPLSGEVEILHAGLPGFVRRLTPEERQWFVDNDTVTDKPMHRDRNLRAAPVKATAQEILQGPQDDLLVLMLTCTHLGCVVLRDAGDFAEEGGFFCPCYGTHYDGLGRQRSGPAPRNLFSPALRFVDDTRAELPSPSLSSISR